MRYTVIGEYTAFMIYAKSEYIVNTIYSPKIVFGNTVNEYYVLQSISRFTNAVDHSSAAGGIFANITVAKMILVTKFNSK